MYSHTTKRSEKSRLDRDLTTLNLNSKMPRMEIARQGTAGSVAWCLLTWKVQASSQKKSCALKRDHLSMHCLQSISDGFQIQKSKMLLHNDVRNIIWLGTGVSHRSISRSESKNPHVSRHRDFGKLRVGKGSFMWEVMLIFWRQDSQPQLRVFENGLWLIFWLDGTRCTSIHGLWHGDRSNKRCWAFWAVILNCAMSLSYQTADTNSKVSGSGECSIFTFQFECSKQLRITRFEKYAGEVLEKKLTRALEQGHGLHKQVERLLAV